MTTNDLLVRIASRAGVLTTLGTKGLKKLANEVVLGGAAATVPLMIEQILIAEFWDEHPHELKESGELVIVNGEYEIRLKRKR